ncbi:MAG: NfeD family protein [Paracoccaceae bacterium]
MMLWQQGWIWVVAAAVLGGLEVVLPGFFLLGFAGGALVVGLLLWLGVLGGSFPMLLLVFAVASLLVWLVARKLAGTRDGQVKLWDRDINE